MTGERIPIFGDHPKGRQIATRDGRWLALATAEGRPVPKTDAERAQGAAHHDRLYRPLSAERRRGDAPRWKRPGTKAGSAASRCAISVSKATIFCTSAAPNCRIRTCSTARYTWSSPGSARNANPHRGTRCVAAAAALGFNSEKARPFKAPGGNDEPHVARSDGIAFCVAPCCARPRFRPLRKAMRNRSG